jgi:uncharacterized protein (TIGR03067 family)
MNSKKSLLLPAVLLLCFAGVWLHRSAQSRRPYKPHLEPFQGRWQFMTRSADGTLLPTGGLLDFTSDVVSYVLPPGTKGGAARFYVIDAVDPAHDPPWIDITERDTLSGWRVAARKGVYRADDGRLTISLARPCEDRPEKVDANADLGNSVWILKRPD